MFVKSIKRKLNASSPWWPSFRKCLSKDFCLISSLLRNFLFALFAGVYPSTKLNLNSRKTQSWTDFVNLKKAFEQANQPLKCARKELFDYVWTPKQWTLQKRHMQRGHTILPWNPHLHLQDINAHCSVTLGHWNSIFIAKMEVQESAWINSCFEVIPTQSKFYNCFPSTLFLIYFASVFVRQL